MKNPSRERRRAGGEECLTGILKFLTGEPFSTGEPSITLLLREWAAGSANARDGLLPMVYEDLKVLSRRMLRRESGGHVTATALVHDLYLKLSRYEAVNWNDRRHFFSFCAGLMRQILTDAARARLADKRSAAMVELASAEELPWIGGSPADYIDLNVALEKLAEIEPEKSKVVELRLYMGCTSEETAEVLGISKATVDRHMAFAKAFLYRELRGSA